MSPLYQLYLVNDTLHLRAKIRAEMPEGVRYENIQYVINTRF